MNNLTYQRDPLGDKILEFLYSYAKDSQKEAKWYGHINVLLTQQLNQCGIGVDSLIVVPQHYLSAEIIEEDEFPLDSSNDGGDPASSETSDDPIDFLTTRKKNPAPQLMQSMKRTRQYLSYRIPDFVRLRKYNLSTTVRTDLLIEVKRLPINPTDRFYLRSKIEAQLENQASHAFKADPDLKIIGCLSVLGNEWAYKRLQRPLARELLRRRPNRDNTYEPSSDSRSSSEATTTADQPDGPPAEVNLYLHDYVCFEYRDLEKHKAWLQLVNENLEEMSPQNVGNNTGVDNQ